MKNIEAFSEEKKKKGQENGPLADKRKRQIKVVGLYFEPSQPLGGLHAGWTQILIYLLVSLHTSNTNHNISTAQLFQKCTHTHKITHISTKPQMFYITVNILLYTKFTSKDLILYRTYQSLSGSQILSPDSHFGTVNTKISPQNISF